MWCTINWLVQSYAAQQPHLSQMLWKRHCNDGVAVGGRGGDDDVDKGDHDMHLLPAAAVSVGVFAVAQPLFSHLLLCGSAAPHPSVWPASERADFSARKLDQHSASLQDSKEGKQANRWRFTCWIAAIMCHPQLVRSEVLSFNMAANSIQSSQPAAVSLTCRNEMQDN